MAYAPFLYRLSRSSASLDSLSCCFPILGRHTADLRSQARWKSTASTSSNDGENASDSPGSGQSPVLEAHLASFDIPEPIKPKERSQESAEDAAMPPTDTLSSIGEGEPKKQELNMNRPRPVQRLVFDEATAATVPGGGDGFVQPWSQAREAQVAKAAEDLQARKQARGTARAADGATTAENQDSEESPSDSFMEPRKLADLPSELKPHFRQIERKRPIPVRVTKIWEMIRSADHIGKRAKENDFVPSVDCSISLFIDPRRSDQLVRGTVSLPHGTGQDTKVAVFASSASDVAAAEAAGAAIVGGEDLVAKVAEDRAISADAVVATPDMVPKLGKIARILGPRGLMPNPKFGTVTTRVAETVSELRRGKVQFRNDKGGTLSASIGRKTFSDQQLTDNFFAFVQAVMNLRPKKLPGSDVTGYVERVSISTTQGKGLPVSFEDLSITAREEFIRKSAV